MSAWPLILTTVTESSNMCIVNGFQMVSHCQVSRGNFHMLSELGMIIGSAFVAALVVPTDGGE